MLRGIKIKPILLRIFDKFENGEYRANDTMEGKFLIEASAEFKKYRDKAVRVEWIEEDMDIKAIHDKL